MSDESIFAAALSKAPGAERCGFLDEACGSDDVERSWAYARSILRVELGQSRD